MIIKQSLSAKITNIREIIKEKVTSGVKAGGDLI